MYIFTVIDHDLKSHDFIIKLVKSELKILRLVKIKTLLPAAA